MSYLCPGPGAASNAGASRLTLDADLEGSAAVSPKHSSLNIHLLSELLHNCFVVPTLTQYKGFSPTPHGLKLGTFKPVST